MPTHPHACDAHSWLAGEVERERNAPTHLESTLDQKREYLKQANTTIAQFMDAYEGVCVCVGGCVGVRVCLRMSLSSRRHALTDTHGHMSPQTITHTPQKDMNEDAARRENIYSENEIGVLYPVTHTLAHTEHFPAKATHTHMYTCIFQGHTCNTHTRT